MTMTVEVPKKLGHPGEWDDEPPAKLSAPKTETEGYLDIILKSPVTEKEVAEEEVAEPTPPPTPRPGAKRATQMLSQWEIAHISPTVRKDSEGNLIIQVWSLPGRDLKFIWVMTEHFKVEETETPMQRGTQYGFALSRKEAMAAADKVALGYGYLLPESK